MLLITPCMGVVDTVNFGKNEISKQMLNFSLKGQEEDGKEEKTQLKSSNEKQEEYAIDSQSGFSVLA
ncbi:hypothetical protein [Campylobacter helveticus]|uniref:Lipoprotein n=1 Tax=Campylobacter helveticus TaxID=28898 RepID=A0AAX2UH53_9BACT|nr:hypothetical protein [Campylobacter helveticus]ARE81168.1 hypothetical protein CHELV3228_1602 [Campylobacter helveticus]MCR2055148.1 hypothetical protein [Campylobacter helveticus]MCR2057289.1 hypothetical protein [Campylobacter helveticus]MCR2059509.1 hypothetical protein [Campylobacter helveticus]MCR2062534.1 hypothetical protein [Campylobacter helveticus]